MIISVIVAAVLLATSILLIAVIQPSLISNHLVHAMGLHKLWPQTFEYPHVLAKRKRIVKIKRKQA